FRVIEASAGQEVLEAVARDRPDVIIMDWTMPGLSGPDLLRRLQRDAPGTPVIVLSGQTNEAEVKLGRSLGAYAYLIKPVSMKTLVDIVKTAVGQSAGGAVSAP
ncbi:MAG TPA: response regulator, partial [Nitrospirales bacterium]|nr:response regulator [Nitrospirales bacterium]